MARKTTRREFVQVAGLAAASGLMAAARPLAAVAPALQTRPTARTMGALFRALMNAPDPLICPGAYDVLTARLIQVHGFRAASVGSSAPNQELVALPDQAVVTVSEIIEYNRVSGSLAYTTVGATLRDYTVVIPVDTTTAATEYETTLGFYQILNQGMGNLTNEPLKPNAPTLSRTDMITFQ